MALKRPLLPNPTKTNCTLYFSEQISEPVDIKIVNIDGKILISKTGILNNSFEIDLSNMPKGTYCLLIYSNH